MVVEVVYFVIDSFQSTIGTTSRARPLMPRKQAVVIF